jgi:hypothetical protein
VVGEEGKLPVLEVGEEQGAAPAIPAAVGGSGGRGGGATVAGVLELVGAGAAPVALTQGRPRLQSRSAARVGRRGAVTQGAEAALVALAQRRRGGRGSGDRLTGRARAGLLSDSISGRDRAEAWPPWRLRRWPDARMRMRVASRDRRIRTREKNDCRVGT